MEKNITIENTVRFIGYNLWSNLDISDENQVNKLLSHINPDVNFDTREKYVSFLAQWRHDYKELSEKSRLTKPLRKGGNHAAAYECYHMKIRARQFMFLRSVLKQIAKKRVA